MTVIAFTATAIAGFIGGLCSGAFIVAYLTSNSA